jgi:hypothetical protein
MDGKKAQNLRLFWQQSSRFVANLSRNREKFRRKRIQKTPLGRT